MICDVNSLIIAASASLKERAESDVVGLFAQSALECVHAGLLKSPAGGSLKLQIVRRGRYSDRGEIGHIASLLKPDAFLDFMKGCQWQPGAVPLPV